MNIDALYILIALAIFAVIDLGIVMTIKHFRRRKAIQQSFANRKPTVIYS